MKYRHEGMISIFSNNYDGTYEVVCTKDAIISASTVANAKLGDIVTTEMGDQYVLIDRLDLYEGYFGEGNNGKSYDKESDYAVRQVGEDVFGYTLVADVEGGYRLYDIDSACAIADGLQGGTMTVEINENSEIYMLKDMMEDVRISPEDFIRLNWDNPTEVLGQGVWDVYLPIYGNGIIENGKLVYFKQNFRS